MPKLLVRSGLCGQHHPIKRIALRRGMEHGVVIGVVGQSVEDNAATGLHTCYTCPSTAPGLQFCLVFVLPATVVSLRSPKAGVLIPILVWSSRVL